MNPEQNNEALPETEQAPVESTEAADLSSPPPVLEGIVPLSPEEQAAKQRAEVAAAEAKAKREFEERKALSLTKDAMEFLPRSQLTDLGNGYYRSGSRFLCSDSSAPFQTSFIQRVAVLHLGGQKSLQYLASQTIFSLEDFQKVFNGVPVEDETKQDLLIRTTVAAVDAAYQSVATFMDKIFPVVGGALGANLEQLRIPAEKDGGKFQSIEALYVPIGARFSLDLLIGVIIKYEGENNHYAVSFIDFSPDPASEEAMDVRAFTDEVLGMRNRYINQYILNTMPDILAQVVGKVGESILKPSEPPKLDPSVDPANVGEAKTEEAAPAHEHHHGHHGHQHHH
jgi:hypothetical protein